MSTLTHSIATPQAFVPAWLSVRRNPRALEAATFLGGVVLLAALAHVQIPLPFTPVPITGQSFGVMLIALLWGRTRALGITVAYLGVGALGLPVFATAPGASTVGYLIGMALASIAMGALSDRGWSRSFARAFAACLVGSVCIFGAGLIGLAFFLPVGLKGLLVAGLMPFIPGDLIKMTLASSIASQVRNRARI